MAKPWEKMYDLWNSLFARDLSKEIPNPTSLSGAGIGRADAIGNAEYLEGGSTFNHAVEITDLNDFLEVGEHTDRRARYLEYDRLENIPEISSALDTYCLSKDSIINTLCGDYTIEQLLKMYPNGENFEVFCFDEEVGDLTVGNAHHVRYTKTDQIYEVKFDDGNSIKCTGDHKFLLRNGQWCEAKDLKLNDSLMPFKRRSIASGYNEVYSIKDGWTREHRFVVEKVSQKKLEKLFEVVHHKNYNKKDNRQENLQVLPKIEHDRLHKRQVKEHTCPEIYRQQVLSGWRNYQASPKGEKEMSENTSRRNKEWWKNNPEWIHNNSERFGKLAKERWDDPNYREWKSKRHSLKIKEKYETDPEYRLKVARPGELNGRYNEEITNTWLLSEASKYSDIKSFINNISLPQSKYPYKKQFVLRRLNQVGYNSWEDFKKNYAYENHKVVSVEKLGIEDVFDITTDKFHNFACNGVIVHNSDEIVSPNIRNQIFEVITKDQNIKDELEWLYYDLLKLNTEELWSWSRNIVKNGDLFLELIVNTEHPELGIQRITELPPETMYRIETVRGRLLEFQQSYMGPDYQAVVDSIKEKFKTLYQVAGTVPDFSQVTTTGNLPFPAPEFANQNTVIRFTPEQICHVRIGLKRRGFYPYGVSILYAARRVAHLLKLMEDAMVIYRLVRAPERRIFYVDVGQVPSHKIEGVLERMRDKIKKKKIFSRNTGQIDERYNAWAVDEDFFIPTRPESNTRIETLPGGQSMNEIDDTKYFREKLMVALKLPKNYLFQEDVAVNRTSYVTQDVRFARTIYKIQNIISAALKQIGIRHLVLKGFPLDDIKKIELKFTAPSDWIELTRSEVLNNRYNLASSVKGAQLYDDYTILTQLLHHTSEEARTIISRMEKQTLRMQEIQAQAQLFAQLATPEPTAQPGMSGSTPGGGGMPGMPGGGGDMSGMPGGPGGMPGGPGGMGSSPEQPQPQPSPMGPTGGSQSMMMNPAEYPNIPTVNVPKTKAKKWTDFTDLEADEEEPAPEYEE